MRVLAKSLLLLALPLLSHADLSWIASNPVANANLYGFAHIDKKVPEVSLGSDTIRFLIEFTSNPSKSPGLLGPYWGISLLDSFAVKKNDSLFEWYAPNGSSYFFFKKTDAKTGKGEVYIQNAGEWILYDSGRDIRVEDGKNKNIFFLYRNGRLVQFRPTEKSGVFSIAYKGKDQPDRIVDEKERKSIVEFSYHSDGLLKSLKAGEQSYQFEYSNSPLASLNGLKALSKITYPDSSSESFSYSMGKPQTRVVIDKNFHERWIPTLPIVRMTQSSSSGSESWLEWCEKSGMITADNGGEYRIGNDKDDPHFSEKSKENMKNRTFAPTPEFVSIAYIPEGKQNPERFFYDFENAIKITQDSHTGKIKKESFIATHGISYLEPRKIEELSGGDIKNPQWGLLQHFSYDNKGRLVRELDKFGNVKQFEYFKDSTDVKKILKNNDLVFQKSFDHSMKMSVIFLKNDDGFIEIKYQDLKTLTGINIYEENGRKFHVLTQPEGTKVFYIEEKDDKHE